MGLATLPTGDANSLPTAAEAATPAGTGVHYQRGKRATSHACSNRHGTGIGTAGRSVVEVSCVGEDHRQIELVGACDDVVVFL